MSQKQLIEFYGRECSHCRNMAPLVARVEREAGVKFERYEVWHDEASARKMEEYDRGYCGGVPFYYNTATKKWVCGETDYEAFKAFATEE
ncbi:MAG: hypothetical protein A2991_02305 [Candidatus Terrybacteria bacterium RIFCSPLOWO2_01_FULL_58_14]|uniref:Thioredoxin domain-containing protein n=2 Tax=Candidatus Terryibacteriota TaxID=1817920 RepID=A0A1G2Q051_9BACT|nr:MAG: hypothetical protein A2682_00925 [Candidatus Terrybacteria bacterium RIFCSPHIGHO2_01_FULL_58_15]OHA53966.1 MAG: hypothetical protein A2991_02305 [Candidatus Terrybacteria bacterium RIFCSPLOWO2_01_FULL_58_14]